MTDRELDAALGALTLVDADPSLADRVVRAIDDAGAARPRWTLPLVPAVAGVAATLLLAAALTWRAAQPVMLPSVAAPPPLVVADAPSSRMEPPDPGVTTAVQVRRSPLIRTEPDSAHGLPALDPLAPVAIDRLRHAVIQREELEIEPLSIAQLAVETFDR